MPAVRERGEKLIAHREDSDEARPLLAESRRRLIAEMVRGAGAVSVAEVEARFGVSSMTARRDLSELERQGVIRRTHGGAVLPAVAAHEDSFAQRVETDRDGKLALAEAALELISPQETIFLDSSSTTYYLARKIVESGIAVTILTNSLPVMQLVGEQASPQVDLIGIGGALRRLTSSFVGPMSIQAIKGHFADRLFFSIKGLAPDGTMTDADPLEAEVKRTMIAQSGSSVLLLAQSKLSARGLTAIAAVSEIDAVIGHGLAASDAAALRSPGLSVRFAGAMDR